MTLVYKCILCGKCFTVPPEAEKKIKKLFGLEAQLHDLGYCIDLHIPSGWEVVRELAKCCKDPVLSIEHYN